MADPGFPKAAGPKKVGVTPPVAAAAGGGAPKKFGGPPPGPKKVGVGPAAGVGPNGTSAPPLSTSPTPSPNPALSTSPTNSQGKTAPVVPPRTTPQTAKKVGAPLPTPNNPGAANNSNASPARARALPTPGESSSNNNNTDATTTATTPSIEVGEEPGSASSSAPPMPSAGTSSASSSDSLAPSEPYVPKSFRSTVNVDSIASLRKGASTVQLNGHASSASIGGGGGGGVGMGGGNGSNGDVNGAGPGDDDYPKPSNATRRIEEALSNAMFTKVEAPIKTKRDNAAYEVLTSEQSYCRSLTILNELFRLTLLEACKRNLLPGVNEELVSNIFSRYFVDISRVNFVLLGGLVERLGQWDESQMLGDLLIELLPFLKMYTLYSGNYERAMSALAELEQLSAKEGHPVSLFMGEVLSNPLRTVDFRSYLIMPIQRIPRYRMLVEELIKGTDQSHPDYAQLQKALESIKEVAIQCDAAIEQHKNRIKMLEIQDSFFGEKVQIIEAGRTFLKEGDMDKVCRKDVQKRRAWLFNDLFLYAKQLPSSSRYNKHRSFPLATIRIKDIPDDGKIYKNAIQIASEKKSFVLLASSSDEKSSWLNEFAKALAGQEKTIRGAEASSANIVVAPVWIPDSEALRCMICGEKFTLMQRRHHCRQCGSVVCSKCSSKKKELPGQGKKRVCDSCYTKPYPDASNSPQLNSNESQRSLSVSSSVSSSTQPVSIGSITISPSSSSSPAPSSAPASSAANTAASPPSSSSTTTTAASASGSTPPANRVSEKYRAAYDYEPPVENPRKKLGFKAGDILEITIKNDPGWWFAIMGDTKGWVPASFLEPAV